MTIVLSMQEDSTKAKCSLSHIWSKKLRLRHSIVSESKRAIQDKDRACEKALEQEWRQGNVDIKRRINEVGGNLFYI